ncbi:MAG: family hydrolase [Anaerocolumna sp.]|jgi:histidine triad (HIT) family protein|nr:family hydrolase [Anaerocolumna sp.]
MDDCVFCKIIDGKIPSMKLYEDEYTIVFMDIAGDVNGHMVAVPKKHVKNILDCDNDTLEHLIKTVKLVSNHCVDKCGFHGVNLLNASDESAGQSVGHFHIHIIPRQKDDGIDAWPDFKGSTVSIQDMYKILEMK